MIRGKGSKQTTQGREKEISPAYRVLSPPSGSSGPGHLASVPDFVNVGWAETAVGLWNRDSGIAF